MTNRSAKPPFITRRLFTMGTGLAALSTLLPHTSIAGPASRLVGDFAWRTAGRTVAGFRASVAKGNPLVVIVHGLSGLNEVTRNLCRHLAESSFYAIAPDLLLHHREKRDFFTPVDRALFHRISDAELERNLAAAVAFAGVEGADVTDCTFVAVSASGHRFTRSRNSRFSSISIHREPQRVSAAAGYSTGGRHNGYGASLVDWLQSPWQSNT